MRLGGWGGPQRTEGLGKSHTNTHSSQEGIKTFFFYNHHFLIPNPHSGKINSILVAS